MEILAIGDLHAEEDVLDRLRVLAGKEKFDSVLVAGDITNNGPVSYAEDLLGIFPHILAVHGNMDPPQVHSFLSQRGVSVHGRKVPFGMRKEWNVVGLGGSNPTPFGTPSESSEEELGELLSRALPDRFSILLSHAPPYGLFDTVGGSMHAGSSAVRSAIEKYRPLMCICAHIHEHEGQAVLKDTIVVKVAAAKSGRAAKITLGDTISVKFFSL